MGGKATKLMKDARTGWDLEAGGRGHTKQLVNISYQPGSSQHFVGISEVNYQKTSANDELESPVGGGLSGPTPPGVATAQSGQDTRRTDAADAYLDQQLEEVAEDGISGLVRELLEKTQNVSTRRSLEKVPTITLSSTPNSPLSYMVDGQSLLYLVVGELGLEAVKRCFVEFKADPWVKNKSDGKCPLHSALERGHVQICRLLLDKMAVTRQTAGKPKLNLKEMSFSLLQKAICNSIPVEKRPPDVDHVDCLEVLLDKRTSLSVFEERKETQRRGIVGVVSKHDSILDLATALQDGEERRLIEKKAQLRIRSPGEEEHESLRWELVRSLLEVDNRDALETLYAKFGNRFEGFLRLPGAPNNMTIFHGVVQCQARHCLEFLLRKNRSSVLLDEPDSRGRVPLHYVANIEDEGIASEILAMFLNAGAHANARDNDGNTLLHKLADERERDGVVVSKLQLVDILLGRDSVDVEAKNAFDFTAIEVLERQSDFNQESFQGEFLDKLLAVKCSQNNSSDSSESWNVPRKYEEFVECLLNDDTDSIQANLNAIVHSSSFVASPQFAGSKTILYHVASKLTYEQLQSLLKLGHDPWVSNSDDKKLPLHAALARGDVMMVELLIHSMKERRNLEIIDLRNISFSLLQSLLCGCKHHSEEHPRKTHCECLQILLRGDVMIYLNQENSDGVAGHDIATWLHLERLRKILNQGVRFERTVARDSVNIDDTPESRTLSWSKLQLVLQTDDPNALELELARHNSRLQEMLSYRYTPKNQTLFHAIVEKRAVNCLRFTLTKITSPRVLDLPDDDGRMPLHYAVLLGLADKSAVCLQMTRLLLKYGACVNARDDLGNSPAHVLAECFAELKPKSSIAFFALTKLILLHKDFDSSALNGCNYTIQEKIACPGQGVETQVLPFRKRIFDELTALLNVQADNSTEGSLRDRLTDATVTNRYDILEKTIRKETDKASAENPSIIENWYVGSKPLLHHIVRHLSPESVERALEGGMDPWLLCSKNRRLALHEALIRGHSSVIETLLRFMRNSKTTKGYALRSLSFSLLKTVLCNARTIAKDGTEPTDHNECLKLVLEDASLSLDVNQNRSFLDPLTALDLAIKTKNKMAERIIREKGGVCSTLSSVSESITITWYKALKILKVDNRDDLELELALRSNRVEDVIRPAGAPHDRTILHCAVENGAANCLEYLVDKIPGGTLLLDEPDKDGNTAIQSVVKRGTKANSGKLSRCLNLLVRGGASVNCRDRNMDTPLHHLSRNSDAVNADDLAVEIYADILLSRTSINLVAVNYRNETPYTYASKNLSDKFDDHASRVEERFPSVQRHEAGQKKNIFMAILMSDKKPLAKSLDETFKHSHIQLKNHYFGTKTLLYCFSELLEVDYIEHALEVWGFDPWKPNIDDGKLPLHAAQARGNLPIVHLLLQKMKCAGKRGTTVNLKRYSSSLLRKTICNYSPLKVKSRQCDQLGCLQRILEPDVTIDVNATDTVSGPLTPLDMARNMGWKEAVDLLIESGAVYSPVGALQVLDPGTECQRLVSLLEADDRDGLEMALCRQGNTNLLRPTRDCSQQTVFHLAVHAKDCIQFLLDTKTLIFHLEDPDSNGMTPLHLAVQSASEGSNLAALLSTRLLLQEGVSVNARDKNGDSPLHLLAEQALLLDQNPSDGCSMCLKVLLDRHDIDVNAINGSMQTPLSKLINGMSNGKCFSAQVCQTLMTHGAKNRKFERSRLERFSTKIPIRNNKFVHSETWQWKLLNSVVNYDTKKLQVVSGTLPGFECNRFIGTKSLMYHLVQFLKADDVENVLQSYANPCLRNVDDGKLPLHVALARGNPDIVKILLKHMRAVKQCSQLDLRPDTFSLLQSVLCNAPCELQNKTRLKSEIDYVKCLDALLAEVIPLDLEQTNSTGDCNLRQLIALIHNEPIRLLLAQKAGVVVDSFIDTNGAISHLDIRKIKEILKNDNRDSLELEMVKPGNDLDYMLREVHFDARGSIFHEAVHSAAPNCLQYLLEQNVTQRHAHIPDENGRTPLHEAVLLTSNDCVAANLSCLKHLIAKKASVNCRDNNGDTPLHLLAKQTGKDSNKNFSGTLTCLEIFLNNDGINTNAKNINQQSPIVIVSEAACETSVNAAEFKKIIDNHHQQKHNNEEAKKEILQDKISQCMISTKEVSRKENIQNCLEEIKTMGIIENRYLGSKPLLSHLVEKKCPIEIIDMFIQCGGDPWAASVGDEKLPLHAAMSRCDVDIVILLLQHMKQSQTSPKPLDLTSLSFSLLQTFLCSCDKNNVDELKCLAQLLEEDVLLDVNQTLAADVNVNETLHPKTQLMEKHGRRLTPLGIARWTNNSTAISLLMNNGAEDAGIPLERESAPFNWAVALDILKRDHRQALELEVASRGGNLELILRPSGAPSKATIFHAAVEHAAPDCLEYLIRKMVTPLQLDEPDIEGRTPLHYAVEFSYTENNPLRLRCLAILLAGGANVNARDKFGDTALHNISQMSIVRPYDDSSYYLHYIDVLLDHKGVDLHAKNMNNQTPLDFKTFFVDKENQRCTKYMKMREKVKTGSTKSDVNLTALLFNTILTDDANGMKRLGERSKEISGFAYAYLGAKTVLYHLIEKMDVSVARQVLSNGFNPWLANIDDGKIPLHVALARGNFKMVALLLDMMKQHRKSQTADLRSISFSLLKTVLCNAQCPGIKSTDPKVDHLQCLQLLIGKDVSLDIDQEYSMDDSRPLTAVDLAGAAGLREYKIVLQQHTNKVLPKNDRCTAPLLWETLKDILIRDDRDSLEIEVARRGDQLETCLRPKGTPKRKTVFHVAIELQAQNCLIFLLNKCPLQKYLNQPDKEGRSPLHYAVVIRQNEEAILPCMKRFLNTPSINLNKAPVPQLSRRKTQHTISVKDNKLETTQLLYFSQTPAVVRELVSRGVYVNSRDTLGDSPLHSLAKQCRDKTSYATHILLQCLDALLCSPETDVDAINHQGETPLEHLMNDVTERPDSISETCKKLVMAGSSAPESIKFQLIQKGKQKTKSPRKRRKREGFTELLHHIVARDEPTIKKFFKMYSGKHMHKWECEFIGDTLFFFHLIANFNSEIVDCFLCFGGDPWTVDLQGNLPLSAALAKGDFRMVDLLITFMKMKNESDCLNLKEWSNSLFITTLQSLGQSAVKPIGINFHKCLKRLFQNDIVISDQSQKLKDLAKDIGDLEALQILANEAVSDWDWEKVTLILDNDDKGDLSVRLQRFGDRVEPLLRPAGSPNSWTLLHTAQDYALSSRNECFELLLESIRTHMDLIARQESSTEKTDFQKSLYHNPLNVPDANGETVLHKAAQYEASRIMEKLIGLGADVNARDDAGNTPLHVLTRKAKKGGQLQESWDRSVGVLLAAPLIDVYAININEGTPSDGDHAAAAKFKDLLEGTPTLMDEPPENMSLVFRLYNCLLTQNVACLNGILENADASASTPLIRNQFIGSKTVLYMVTSLLESNLVKGFIALGCDPWQRNVDGKLPLHLALEQGHVATVDVLIEGMKAKRNEEYVDLTEFSFSFLTIPLIANKEAGSTTHVINHDKCLKRLLKNDVLLDINAVDMSGSSHTALQVAAIVGDQSAMKMLLTKGAFIGIKRSVKDHKTGGILGALVPTTLEKAIDKCVDVSDYKEKKYTSTDVVHPLFALQLDYSFLLPPVEHEIVASRGNTERNTTSYQVAETVLEIGEDPNHQNCLQLPLMEALLDAKWRSIYHLIIGNAVITVLFLLMLVAQCIFLNLSMKNIIVHQSETVMVVLSVLLMILAFCLVLRESLEFITSMTNYFRRVENYLEWFLISSSVIVSFVPLKHVDAVHVSAWTTVIAFYELLLTFEHVFEGHYIGKFRFTVRNIARYFVWFAVPMGAFSIGLWILYAQANQEFSFSLHIAKVYAMAAGDFEQYLGNEALANDSLVAFSLLLYFLVFFVMILLSQMILITAMTISDVGEFTQSVQFHTKRSKWKVVQRYEQMLDTVIWLRNLFPASSLTAYLDRFVRRFQQPNTDKPTILLRLNESSPDQRMILSDGVHEYYRTVSDKLATKFRLIYLKNLDGDDQDNSRVEGKLDALHFRLEQLGGSASSGAGNTAALAARRQSVAPPKRLDGDVTLNLSRNTERRGTTYKLTNRNSVAHLSESIT